MKLVSEVTLPFARPHVFATYRDHLADLLPYIRNVRGIEPRSRVERGSLVEIVNVWHGGGDIPAVARAVISESMLSWTDHATWDEAAFVCEWRIETHAFTDAVSCMGRHTFVSLGTSVRLETSGTITIDATKIRAVPRLFASRVGHRVEEFLAAKIRPNLTEVSRGLGEYLASSAAQR